MAEPAGPSRALIALYAVATGAIVANLYYAQPLVALIAPDLHMPAPIAGLLVTFTQIGYAAGLLLLVPLGDLVENRALSVRLIAGAVLALALAALAWSWPVFLAAALLIGLGSTAVQILVPMIATLTPEATRGRVVGTVMGGLVFGILLARPAASLIAYVAGWRAVFALSALGMAALAILLQIKLPITQPTAKQRYGALIASMVRLYITEPTLRRRALYQSAAFAAFSLYWTAIPLYLIHAYHFTQFGIAIFALVGAGGAIAAPLAGRLADAGYSRPGSAAALTLVLTSFAISALGATLHSVILLALAGVALDFGVQANNVFGQRAIYTLAPELRARLNGAYMAAFFLGGAIGSAVASTLLTTGGWLAVAAAGAAAPAAALAYFTTTELTRQPAPHPG